MIRLFIRFPLPAKEYECILSRRLTLRYAAVRIQETQDELKEIRIHNNTVFFTDDADYVLDGNTPIGNLGLEDGMTVYVV